MAALGLINSWRTAQDARRSPAEIRISFGDWIPGQPKPQQIEEIEISNVGDRRAVGCDVNRLFRLVEFTGARYRYTNETTYRFLRPEGFQRLETLDPGQTVDPEFADLDFLPVPVDGFPDAGYEVLEHPDGIFLPVGVEAVCERGGSITRFS